MEEFWKKALSVTGSVAVVGFILTIFIDKIFNEEVIKYFGSENFFYLVIGILFVLGAALIISILYNRTAASTSGPKNNIESKNTGNNQTATITNSKINGDIVFGNKTINQDGKNE
jgi:hypothetical protein